MSNTEARQQMRRDVVAAIVAVIGAAAFLVAVIAPMAPALYSAAREAATSLPAPVASMMKHLAEARNMDGAAAEWTMIEAEIRSAN